MAFYFRLVLVSLLFTQGYAQSSPTLVKTPTLSRFGVPAKFSPEKPFPFSNPNAPKGGTLKLSNVGTFDNLNRFVVKGTTAEGTLICYEGMMMRSPGEPFTLYPLLAESVTVASDHSSITFHINPKAKFSNGDKVTAEDAKFTYETLRDKGAPRYKHFFSSIESLEVLDAHTLKITFKANAEGKFEEETPMVVALVSILSKKQLESMDFQNMGMNPLIGSGPYSISSAEVGRFVEISRNKEYWGKDLPQMQGLFNFDVIRVDYYKNEQAQRQAFMAGEFHVMFETNPNQFFTGYKGVPAIESGKIVKEEYVHQKPVAVRYLSFNMRHAKFADWSLRRALVLAFDFDTLNRMVFDGAMKTPTSLFANTFLAHKGKAEGLEAEILAEFKAKIEPEIFETLMASEFDVAHTKGNGDQRENLIKADKILTQAGYLVKNGQRLTPQGAPVKFEVMIKDPRLEKLVLAFKQSLKKLGIDLAVRMMDAVQYENRVLESDFDMIVHVWSNSLSPGAEQLYYFGVEQASRKGSSNYLGIADPVAEEFARKVAHSPSQEYNTAAVKALDRYVMHMCYQIPVSYDPTTRWLYWKSKIEMPPLDPHVGLNVINYGWAPGA